MFKTSLNEVPCLLMLCLADALIFKSFSGKRKYQTNLEPFKILTLYFHLCPRFTMFHSEGLLFIYLFILIFFCFFFFNYLF